MADLAGTYAALTSPSGATYMALNYTLISRSRIRVYGNIHLGSATSCGTAEERTMRLVINGTTKNYVVKPTGTNWGPNSNHPFDYTFDFNDATSGTEPARVYVLATETQHGNPSVTFDTGSRTITVPSSMLRPEQGSQPSVSPSSYPEDDITISWAATPYATAYYVDYYDGSWHRLRATSARSISASLAAIASRGETIGFAINPYNSYGSGGRSPARYVTRNRAPNKLATAPTPNNTLIEPGTTIRLSFTNAGDPDGNLAGYEAAMKDAAGEWYKNGKIVGSRSGSSITYLDVDTTGWIRGNRWRFYVRGYDSRGVRGAWSSASAYVKINSAPPAPSSITVSPSPFEKSLTVSWPSVTDPDGNLDYYQLQRRIANDGSSWGEWATVRTQTSRTWTEEPPVNDGGLVQYRVRAVDKLDQVSSYKTSAQVKREDGSGLKVRQGGAWVKTDIFMGGVKHEVFVRQGGGWVEAEK